MECYVRINIAEIGEKVDHVYRRVVKKEIHRVLSSEKVIEGEAFPDGSGGLFHVHVERPEDLFKLLGAILTATCSVESNPVFRCGTA